MMKVAVIGCGAAGLYSAILLKKNNREYEVTVFEKEEKLAKKVYATGNGHCNVLNKKLLANKYNNIPYFKNLLKDFSYASLKEELSSWGVMLLENGDYVYPLSFSASSFVSYLLSYGEKIGVRFLPAKKVSDYEKTQDGYQICDQIFDKVVIATGAKSSPNLGSDGSFLSVLRRHGYQWNEFKPGLAPIRVAENVKSLQGIRHHALVKASSDKKQIFEEEGEVLFKKDGLSGIVIFNAESALFREKTLISPKITIDLFPEYSFYSLCDKLNQAKIKNPEYYLSSFLVSALADYVTKEAKNKNVDQIAQTLKHLTFSVTGSYGFEDSQVSLGGIPLNEVTPFLESKKESGVYFVGEILDADGYCGGYNLSWALISAVLVSKHV